MMALGCSRLSARQARRRKAPNRPVHSPMRAQAAWPQALRWTHWPIDMITASPLPTPFACSTPATAATAICKVGKSNLLVWVPVIGPVVDNRPPDRARFHVPRPRRCKHAFTLHPQPFVQIFAGVEPAPDASVLFSPVDGFGLL